ncbi:hypothetical protein [Marinigracilibium pacificum]|uniref:Uncharacterized protein n=1 Tax=Marinigracilibium pacificum TaxID=2729599 RepID=A0A848IVY4_9BACT|nr:hypothetical protein [Marinigracilibium pacificum]NMM47338.1 hypothetical protein [Marinigracilibium pacificum]
MEEEKDDRTNEQEKQEISEVELLNKIQEQTKTRQQALIKIMKQLNSGNK